MNKAHEDINWVNYPLTDTALNASNLNKMDRSIDVIDDRVVAMDTTKANTTDMLQAFIDVDIDDTTGVLTFTKKNGTTVTLNTNLNKIATNMRYDADPSSATYQKLILTYNTTPVTYGYIDLTALITQYEFTDSSIIHFSVTSGMVSATIIDGSITAEKLQPNFLADCQSAKNDAESAQQGANQNALVSEGWAKGTQNGIAVTSESIYFHNNSEWFKNQAQEIAGGSLAGLSDTEIDNPTQGQVLVYDEASEVWINGNPSAGILPHLHILTESDATVTIAGLTPTQTSAGVWDVDIPSYGTYLVQSVNSSGTQNVTVVVDACKIYEVSAYHFNATITVTFPAGATCTCAKSGVTYTATSTPYTFTVNTAGTWMVSITQDGQTVAQNVSITTTGQTETLTLDFAYITVTIPAASVGSTVVITDGTSTRSWVSDSTSHTFVCILGTYTLSMSGFSTTVVVSEYTTYTATISTLDPSTADPNVLEYWLYFGEVEGTYSTLSDVLADSTALSALMASQDAVIYLARCDEWITDITSNQSAMSYIGLNNYCANTLLGDADWLTAIANSTYKESVLNVKVPTMTSATTPSGIASESSSYSSGYVGWKALDGIGEGTTNTGWMTASNPATAYMQYDFGKSFKPYAYVIRPYYDSGNCRTTEFKMQGSTDDTFTDISEVQTFPNGTTSATVKTFVGNVHTNIQKVRLLVTGSQDTYYGCNALQIYGREDV